jgi:hypothetical protein
MLRKRNRKKMKRRMRNENDAMETSRHRGWGRNAGYGS